MIPVAPRDVARTDGRPVRGRAAWAAFISIIAITVHSGVFARDDEPNDRPLAPGVRGLFTVNFFDIPANVSVTEFGCSHNTESILVTHEAPDIQKTFWLYSQIAGTGTAVYDTAAMSHFVARRQCSFTNGGQAFERKIIEISLPVKPVLNGPLNLPSRQIPRVADHNLGHALQWALLFAQQLTPYFVMGYGDSAVNLKNRESRGSPPHNDS